MSWYSFRPYVRAADRQQLAEAASKRFAAKAGRALLPVRVMGRLIASTFWGKAWCENLESYSDYANRLPRGRSYVRNGCVIDLQISTGKVEAMVQGSSLYKVAVNFTRLTPKRWAEFKSLSAGKVTNLLDLLQGRLSKDILSAMATPGTGLFPSPKEISLECSCPDWADMCKHVAAVLYGVGARLDEKPELFFTLRGVDMQELVTAASATATAPVAKVSGNGALAGADLEALFGVTLETSPSVQQGNPGGAARQQPKSKSKKKKPLTKRGKK